MNFNPTKFHVLHVTRLTTTTILFKSLLNKNNLKMYKYLGVIINVITPDEEKVHRQNQETRKSNS